MNEHAIHITHCLESIHKIVPHVGMFWMIQSVVERFDRLEIEEKEEKCVEKSSEEDIHTQLHIIELDLPRTFAKDHKMDEMYMP
jgi:hypothetical protein